MIMADQDVDGSHIKGLLVNLFHTFWPALLQPVPAADGHNSSPAGPSFLEQFITPVIKARRGTASKDFFSVRAYETWRASEPGAARWSIKYYKGLGTSTSAEGRAYFGALTSHRKPFTWGGPGDGERVVMAFAKARADDRKAWLLAAAADDGLAKPAAASDHDSSAPASAPAPAPTPTRAATPSLSVSTADGSAVTIGDFIDRELIEFSRADLIRSIPSAVDGLKPSQRKVLYACFKRAGGSRAGAASSVTAAASDVAGTAGGDDNVAGSATATDGSSSTAQPATAVVKVKQLVPPASLGSEVKVCLYLTPSWFGQ
jgi:DNA topoisomerase-2